MTPSLLDTPKSDPPPPEVFERIPTDPGGFA
jgi:hypothetical protein